MTARITSATVSAPSPLSAVPAGAFQAVSTRIAAHAATTPHRPAVADTAGQWTYGDIEGQGNRWAAALRASGVGPGTCVGVLLSRSARYVVAVLAVLKTGAAYLPLDPATPQQRIEYILGDAGAAVVLTEHDHAGTVPPGPWVAIDLDEAPTPSAVTPAAAPPGESLAYIIYTSGSTGRPKGVEITHANLAHLVDWHNAAFGVTADDRASQVAGLGFDAAVWEIWPHLAAGASLHVADDRTHRSPQILRDWLVAQEITISFAPTLLAEQLMHADWPSQTALRTLLTGAERLHRRPAPGLPFTVINNYGPTECTVVSTSGAVAPETDHPGPPSIGRPIPGTVALLLDEHLRPVADDEPGELVLVGPHVGRGYRNDPEKTAARFVSVHTDDGTAVRAYRTGDRVRHLDDGRLTFLGRLDEQVKVRGHRIEPAEIVEWLTRCPGVESAAVILLDGDADHESAQPTGADRELAAYVVPTNTDRPPDADDVRAFLAAQLPDYMVPVHVVTMPTLPTTSNGKLDVAALPRPVEEQAAAPETGVTDVEGWLQELVADLLQRSEVGVDDNIFLLGGHSMLAMQVVSRVRQRYEVELTLRQLFRGPTVAGISAEVARLQGARP